MNVPKTYSPRPAVSTQTIRLVAARPLQSSGFASPAARVAVSLPASAEAQANLVQLILARVHDETGISLDAVEMRIHHDARFTITAPPAFLSRLLVQPEVTTCPSPGLDL